jgi:hypothetical protein
MSDANYVTQEAWLDAPGRDDLIDELADQFERPAAAYAQVPAWPLRSRGWRATTRWAADVPERRAG